jgi:hypothetical protein
MSKTIQAVLLCTLALAAALGAGCGTKTGQPAAATSTPKAAATGTASAKPVTPTAASPTLRETVHADIGRIMADIKTAEQRGDVVDGVPVGQSSNPYDYVGVSPAFTKLVALGKPALPAIVAEIEASAQNGLREYLLAAAGAQIDGDTPGSGAQTWSTGKDWARQYRADD